MNDYLQAILLGVIQGLAEFLPISSSGHLVIAKHLLGWCGDGEVLSSGKELEVLLHIGTLGSILVVYAGELRQQLFNWRQWALVVVASIPAAVVGLTLEDWFDQAFDTPAIAGFGLLVTAALLVLGQRLEHGKYDLKSLPWVSAVVIGCFQAVALVPGISRSGSTISGGLLTGVDRVSATRFSFLLAIPVTAGAIVLTLKHAVEHGGLDKAGGPEIVGIAVSFVVGWLSLRLLIRLMTQRKLHWFAGYCLALGLATIVVAEAVENGGTARHAAAASDDATMRGTVTAR